jgi:hypothetical protein
METPNYFEARGTGTFSFQTTSFQSELRLLRNPYWSGVLAQLDNQVAARLLLANPGAWHLRGLLEDGRPIQSYSLLDTGPTDGSYNVGFSILEDLQLGTSLDGPPTYSEFPLVNYFDGPASLTHRGWKLSISSGQSLAVAEVLAKQWRLAHEGMTLECTRSGSSPQEHLDIARNVMAVTSLALGTGVSCHRHIFHWDDASSETWRFMVGDELGPGPAIPAHRMCDYLALALPAFEALPPERQFLFRMANTYINLSEGRYLDTRLLAIVQAWEFLSSEWVDKPPLAPDLVFLRSRLTAAIKDWRRDHPTSDPDGFWGGRIVAALDWARLNDQLERFAALWHVDLSTLGVDLGLLRRVRDSVARSGKLPQGAPATSEERLNLLRNARHALRLTLLKMLGYSVLVIVNKDGCRAFAKMEEALQGRYGAA